MASLHGFKIAVLLIGETFRSPGLGQGPCTATSVDAQQEATTSYHNNVVLPLRKTNEVHTFITISECPLANYSAAMQKWMPHSTVEVIKSRDMEDGWRKGYLLVRRYMRTHGIQFDFIFQGRNDIMIPESITLWPSNWSSMLFEKEARYCHGGCYMGTVAGSVKECGQASRLCSADRLFWVPSRHFRVVFQIARHGQASGYSDGWGHSFMHNFHRQDYDFMFPDCEQYQTQLTCEPLNVYRPLKHRKKASS